MEYSIVNKSNLENIAFRLDAEYYHPDNLNLFNKLLSINHKRIGDIAFVTDGIHESISFDPTSKILLISAKAPKENYFKTSRLSYISEEQDSKNPRTHLKVDDIIISTVGTIGNCAVVDKSILPANSDRHVGIIRIQNKKFKPRFISSFLLSKYGRFQSIRESTGNVQLNLFIYKINEILCPDFTDKFQEKIENICFTANNYRFDSQNKYHQARTLLLSKLGLLDWKPQHHLTFVKNYSDALQSGRFDAEYYQPKYDEIVESIKNYSGGWDTVKNLLQIKDKTISPSEKVEYKYIELANIGNNGEITGFMEAEGQDLPSRARRKVKKDDVIVSSIEGSLTSIALIQDEYDGALCSTGFHIINSDIINPQTLLVLLKSPIGQEQLKKGCSGTILTAINKDEIGNVVLPIVNSEIQSQIQHKVTESFTLRKQSKHLLECAKRAVEMAIEENEETAMRWLESQIDSTTS